MAKPAEWTYNYETLKSLTGLSVNNLQQHRARGTFDPGDLASVLAFIARYGTDDLKSTVVDLALRRDYHLNQDKPPKKAAKKVVRGKKPPG